MSSTPELSLVLPLRVKKAPPYLPTAHLITNEIHAAWTDTLAQSPTARLTGLRGLINSISKHSAARHILPTQQLSRLWLDLGLAYGYLGEHHIASKAFVSAVALDGNCAIALFAYGLAQAELGLWKGATWAFQACHHCFRRNGERVDILPCKIFQNEGTQTHGLGEEWALDRARVKWNYQVALREALGMLPRPKGREREKLRGMPAGITMGPGWEANWEEIFPQDREAFPDYTPDNPEPTRVQQILEGIAEEDECSSDAEIPRRPKSRSYLGSEDEVDKIKQGSLPNPKGKFRPKLLSQKSKAEGIVSPSSPKSSLTSKSPPLEDSIRKASLSPESEIPYKAASILGLLTEDSASLISPKSRWWPRQLPSRAQTETVLPIPNPRQIRRSFRKTSHKNISAMNSKGNWLPKALLRRNASETGQSHHKSEGSLKPLPLPQMKCNKDIAPSTSKTNLASRTWPQKKSVEIPVARSSSLESLRTRLLAQAETCRVDRPPDRDRQPRPSKVLRHEGSEKPSLSSSSEASSPPSPRDPWCLKALKENEAFEEDSLPLVAKGNTTLKPLCAKGKDIEYAEKSTHSSFEEIESEADYEEIFKMDTGSSMPDKKTLRETLHRRLGPPSTKFPSHSRLRAQRVPSVAEPYYALEASQSAERIPHSDQPTKPERKPPPEARYSMADLRKMEGFPRADPPHDPARQLPPGKSPQEGISKLDRLPQEYTPQLADPGLVRRKRLSLLPKDFEVLAPAPLNYKPLSGYCQAYRHNHGDECPKEPLAPTISSGATLSGPFAPCFPIDHPQTPGGPRYIVTESEKDGDEEVDWRLERRFDDDSDGDSASTASHYEPCLLKPTAEEVLTPLIPPQPNLQIPHNLYFSNQIQERDDEWHALRRENSIDDVMDEIAELIGESKDLHGSLRQAKEEVFEDGNQADVREDHFKGVPSWREGDECAYFEAALGNPSGRNRKRKTWVDDDCDTVVGYDDGEKEKETSDADGKDSGLEAPLTSNPISRPTYRLTLTPVPALARPQARCLAKAPEEIIPRNRRGFNNAGEEILLPRAFEGFAVNKRKNLRP